MGYRIGKNGENSFPKFGGFAIHPHCGSVNKSSSWIIPVADEIFIWEISTSTAGTPMISSPYVAILGFL
jgi:hypothetical protein